MKALGVDARDGSRISKEWAEANITASGIQKAQQLTSLRKKMFLHAGSKSHKISLKKQVKAKEKQIQKSCLKVVSKRIETTEKIFRTAYKIARKNRAK